MRKFTYDPSSPSQKRADALALADENLIAVLVRLRDELGMTQTDVAKKLGISQPAVCEFERAGNDPRLSTIRRYAHAIGVYIEHTPSVDAAEWGRPVAERLTPTTANDWSSVLRGSGKATVRSEGRAVQVAVDSRRIDFALAS